MLKRKMAAKDIFTFVELAKRAKCSVSTVYFMIERPSRFTPTYNRIKAILDVKNDAEILTPAQKETAHV